MAARVLGAGDGPAVASYLAGRAVECLFLASNLETYGPVDRGGMLEGTWLGYFRGDTLAGVAQLVNQGSLLVAATPPEAPAGFAALVRDRGYHPARIMGMRPEVKAMQAALRAAGGPEVRETRDSLLQVLTPETFEPRGAAGARPATAADVPGLLAWKRRFRVEAMGDDPAWVDDEVLRRSLEITMAAGHQYVFEAGGRVVSMARLNARTAKMAQLGGVYTPPEERGNGYASRLISAVCADCLGPRGLEAVALMVDEGKTSANKIYRDLGFLGLGVYRFLLLDPGEPEA